MRPADPLRAALHPFGGKVSVVARDENVSEGVADCTVVIGPLGDVRSAGGSTTEVLGVAPRELSGLHLKELLSRPDRGRLFDLMREALAGRPPALGNQIVAAGGSTLVSVVPMEADGAGHVDSWVLRFVSRPVEVPAVVTRPSSPLEDLRPDDLSPEAIERALRDERFGLDLQPIIDLETGRPVECEALVRWLRPDGERLPAGGFIEAIERAGLMPRLTDYVMERSLDQLAGWSGEEANRGITVNVSASDLATPDFAARVGKLVAAAGADPSRLLLEFGADLLTIDHDTLARIFARLRDTAGVRLGIDQQTARRSPLTAFGLGIDAVKLDPAASWHAAGSTIDASILAMFTDVCRTSGIAVIGTGIEEELQLEAVQRAGCSHGQGYLLGRPSPSSALVVPGKRWRPREIVPRPAQPIPAPDLQRAIDRWRDEVDRATAGAS